MLYAVHTTAARTRRVRWLAFRTVRLTAEVALGLLKCALLIDAQLLDGTAGLFFGGLVGGRS